MTQKPNGRRLTGVFACGIAIGLADLVPGVSGGTLALITGIYGRLIKALNLCASPTVWLFLFKGQLRVMWRAIDGTFLLVLFSGAVVAIVTAATPLRHLLINQSIALLSFFCGLTFVAALRILYKLRPFNLLLILCVLGGMGTAMLVVFAPTATLQNAPPLSGYFLAGMLALCAMILPGISGSFVLLLIGVYPFLIDAVHELNFAVLLSFASGGLLGLALFAKLLRKLLVHLYLPVMAVLASFMLGVLPKLWPWKEQTGDIRQILQIAVWPTELPEPQYLLAGACFVFGILAVLGIEYWANYFSSPQVR